MLLIMGCIFSKKPSEEVIPEPVVVTISALFDGSKDAQERMMELREVERMESSRGSIISIPLETRDELSFKLSTSYTPVPMSLE